MSKKTNSIALIIIFCLSVVFIVGFAAVGIKTAISNLRITNNTKAVDPKKSISQEDAALFQNSESVLFSNIEDYEAYLLVCAAEESNSDNVTAAYYAPATAPDGTELNSIEVNNLFTVFDYRFTDPSRNVAYDDTDETLNALFNTYRSVVYYSNNYSFVSDFREYAENFAANLNAALYSSSTDQDVYYADVYVDVTTNGITQSVFVGQQTVMWRYLQEPVREANEIIAYWFFPYEFFPGGTSSNMPIDMTPHYVSSAD